MWSAGTKIDSNAAGFVQIFAFVVIQALSAPAGWAEPCRPARQIGSLDQRLIPEASGMAASAAFPGRLYFINDGGNGPYFFVTDVQGKIEQSVRMTGPENPQADYEGMSLGPCSDAKSCLFIGDIGDNHAKRAQVELLIFEEVEEFTSPAGPLRRLTLFYPDGPHDAEGLAVHPNGDVYVLTKGMDYEAQRAWPSKLFRLRRQQWEQATGPQTLTLLGELDLARIATNGSGLRGLAATGFDIAPDGSRFLVLTYADAFELPIDLGVAGLDLGREVDRGRFRTIRLQPLPQQECAAYLPDARSVLYATESKAKRAEIMQVDCGDSRTGATSRRLPP
jgi:hypothetical protein